MVAVCVLFQACGAGWHREPIAPGALPPRQQVQVWHEGRPEQWHALVVSADSVSGVPYLQPVGCDGCRMALPSSAVDSIRLGNPVAGFWKTVGLAIGIPLAVFFIVCATQGGGPPCSEGS